jgi:NTP pyrophosphatase (non-canonical NTP hydrolase)
MDEKTYIALSARTKSDNFHQDLLPPNELRHALAAAGVATNWINDCKRTLYYGSAPVLRTGKDGQHSGSLKHDPALADLLHAALGLFTEAGEILEHLQQVLSGAQPFDKINLLEELGDIEWYRALALRSSGLTPEEVRAKNHAKLVARFPDKFTKEEAEGRDLEAERKALEEGYFY